MIVFGGITWTETDLISTDTWRDRDRRCFKMAKDLPSRFHDKAMAKQFPQLKVLEGRPEVAADMVRNLKYDCANPARQLCCVLAEKLPDPELSAGALAKLWNSFPDEENNPKWCKTEGQWDDTHCRKKVIEHEKITAVGRDPAGKKITKTYDLIVRAGPAKNYFNLMAMREMCQSICAMKEFQAEFVPNMKPGVWRLRPDKCPNECSGRGVCEFSHCVCEPGWSGTDCSIQSCPGSPCYSDPNSSEYFCVECSGKGSCVNIRDEPFWVAGAEHKTVKRHCKCNIGYEEIFPFSPPRSS